MTVKFRAAYIFGFLAPFALGSGHASASKVIELANVAGAADFTLNIETVCSGQDPVFRLTNTGSEWPRIARVKIEKEGDERPVFNRNMRMKSGQKATFRLPVKRLGPGEYSLAVYPSWYQREVTSDVTLSCN